MYLFEYITSVVLLLFCTFVDNHLINKVMDANRVFVQDLNKYYDGDLDCKSIIVPTSFGLRKVDCDIVVGKIDNKEIRITEKICMDYTMVGNYVWSSLASKRSYLPYAIVGYIANAIKYNSNVIRINPDIIKGIVCAEIDNRTYLNAIAHLKRINVIKPIDARSMYEVNPLAVFKGSIYKFINIAEQYGIVGYVDDGNKILLDKFGVVEHKTDNVKVILNKKYYKDAPSRIITEKVINASYDSSARR